MDAGGRQREGGRCPPARAPTANTGFEGDPDASAASTGDRSAAGPAEQEPGILVAVEDRWTRVLICAELRERGYVAGGGPPVAATLLAAAPEPLRRATAVLVEYETLRDRDLATLRWFRAIGGFSVVVLAPASARLPSGPWDRVLRRPLTIGAVADAVEPFVGSSESRPPPRIASGAIDLRFGPPWPAGLCSRCGTSRHCQPPHDATDGDLVRTALVQFALEHQACRDAATSGSTRA